MSWSFDSGSASHPPKHGMFTPGYSPGAKAAADKDRQLRWSVTSCASEVKRSAENLTAGHNVFHIFMSQAQKALSDGIYSRFWDEIESLEPFIDRLDREGDALRVDFASYSRAVSALKDYVGQDAEVSPIGITWEEIGALTQFDIYRVARYDLINDGLRIPECAVIYEMRRGSAAIQTAIHGAANSILMDRSAESARRQKSLDDLQWTAEQIRRRLSEG
jgi:hypothetical protein